MLAAQEMEALRWEAREVVREIDDRPHLLVRVTVAQGPFPHRAPEPFMRIVDAQRQATMAWFADVGEDGDRLDGYFPTDLPGRGVIEFGYGDQTIGRVAADFRNDRIERLERDRLPDDVVPVTTAYIRERTIGR
jgi:hypothetical protein